MSRKSKLKRKVKRAEARMVNRGETREKPLVKKPGYDEIERDNENFRQYYKAQGIVKEEEWDVFNEILKTSLPASFRINSCHGGQTTKLKSIIAGEEFSSITVDSADGKPETKAVTQLTWETQGYAFQLNFSRTEIRRSEALLKLHNFLISESENGYITRQEAVSMLPPLVLDVKPHHNVLDACASPGSKTAQIIEMLQKLEKNDTNNRNLKSGMVVANDIDSKRCYMLVHQAKRLHSPCFVISNHDAGNMPYFLENTPDGKKVMKFDRILADVPCTGDGTMRKNVDVWLKWGISNGNHFHGIQMKIAKKCLELLKKDGLMVYSTCSLNPLEDESVIASLLERSQGGLELVDVRDKLPGLKSCPGLENWKVFQKDGKEVKSLADVDPLFSNQIIESMFPPENVKSLNLDRCIRILPHLQNTGGFFVSVFRKTVENLPWEISDEKIIENFATGKFHSLSDGPPMKRRRGCGYREDPFYVLDTESDEWKNIKKFYQITDEFPVDQLVCRSSTAKRNIYLLTKAAKDVIASNEEHIKFVNAGVRLFTKIDDKVCDCGYRITQEGLPSIFPFLNAERFLLINSEEFHQLMTTESTKTEFFRDVIKQKLEELPSGCCTAVYKGDIVDNHGEKHLLTLPISCWKGAKTIRPFVSKSERIHFLRMLDMDTTELEKAANEHFKERQEKRKQRTEMREQEEMERDSDIKNDDENDVNQHIDANGD